MPRILGPTVPLQITEPPARRQRVSKSPITPPPACEQFVKKSPSAAAGRPAKGENAAQQRRRQCEQLRASPHADHGVRCRVNPHHQRPAAFIGS
ncbi:MAG: hypothetical protein LBK71_03980 [Verrucomicrobiales bacterium]|nr:hypothetical protein [Verrucomicrobiales bacterium]